MAPPHHKKESLNLTQEDPRSVFYDALYCEEDQHWDEAALTNDCFLDAESSYLRNYGNDSGTTCRGGNSGLELLHRRFTEEDLCWEADELANLLSKEDKSRILETRVGKPDMGFARPEAVEWMMRVHARYSFDAPTAILAVNYLDRFFLSFQFQGQKPWMTQLAAVACLSIAAKVEETHVPLLLDLQVGEAKYVFEPKTIQRMEILVLSTLGWKMNPVTSHSFIDYITRRLRLRDNLGWEFLWRCERVVLSILSDSRFMSYLPSVIAAAAMLHVVSSLEPCIADEYQNQLLGILGSDKDRVEECRQFILELASGGKILFSRKRKCVSMPGSPNGVIDVSFGSDSSNDSWAATSSVSSSHEPLSKKVRTEDTHSERFSHHLWSS